MKIYTGEDVYTAALARIGWVFDNFPVVRVSTSGGKDSTAILNLALAVAAQRGRLPLEVMFLDQEAEYATVIAHLRRVMADPRVKPLWYQVPIKMFNATSSRDPWLYAWDPAAESRWMRPREPGSIAQNTAGTDRFHEFFAGSLRHDYPDRPAAYLAGVRAEESPARMQAVTANETYKGVTWGRVETKALDHYAFYPLYDWSYGDVWHAIEANQWPYCPIYDHLYRKGVPVTEMRVSNLHHETAVRTLYYLQEVEADTWDRLVARLGGIHAAGTLGREAFVPKRLPPMFADWREYRDHLLETLVTDPAKRERMRRRFALGERQFMPHALPQLIRTHVAIVLTNDFEMTKLQSFEAANRKNAWGRGAKSGYREVDYGAAGLG